VPLLFLASLAALFPGLALPITYGWKSIRVFDVLFGILVWRAWRGGALNRLDSRLALATGSFFIAGCAALWTAPTHLGTRSVLTTAYSLAVFLFAAHCRVDWSEIRKIILGPLAIAIALAWAVFAIENGFAMDVAQNQSAALPSGLHRLGGFTGGNALILFICLGAGLIQSRPPVQAALLMSGYATLSRSMTGLGCAILLGSSGLRARSARGFQLVVAGLAVFAIVAGVMAYLIALPPIPGDWSTRVLASWDAGLPAGPYRVLHRAALLMFLDAPLLGHGPGRFIELFQVYTTPAEHELVAPGRPPSWDPHSAILGLAAEQGLVGLVSFAWLLLEVYRRLLKMADAENRRHALAAVIGLLVGGHFVDWFPLKGLWLWMGLLVAAARTQSLESLRKP
jgi:hypothetical protein